VLPSQIKGGVSPFTVPVRRRIVDTELTLRILKLDFQPSRNHAKSALLSIMADYGLQVSFIG